MSTTLHLAITQDSFVNCMLFPGQRQDCKSIQELWKTWSWSKIKCVVADKGYDNSIIRGFLRNKNVQAVIPHKNIWTTKDSELTPEDFYDVKTYKKRHVIERFFGRLKENKRIAMRYDKLDHTFLSFIVIAIAKLYKLFC